MRITQLTYDEFKENIDELISQYRENFSVPVVTDWKDYEFLYRERMKGMALELRAMINESSTLVVDDFGRPSLLNAREKVFIILVKEIFRLSNRKAAYLLPLLGITKEISYKTVERLYSDPLVIMILNNLFVASVKRKGIDTAETSGDGTGHSLTVTKHYRSLREKNGEIVKEDRLVYSFALMDLSTRMYVGYAVSVKSERDAYYRVLDMIKKMNIDLKSVRLDRYYSGQSILEDFSENTMIFIIPKKNSRIRGRSKWRDIIRRFMDDPMNYLREYFKRNASESGFCKGLIHNLMLLHS